MSLPCIYVYPGDWLRDDVAGCSLAAQGLWLRMMFIMHDSDRYGYLSKNGAPIPPGNVASRCGIPVEQYVTLLAELDTVSVPRRTPDGTIYSKRMVDDARERAERAKNSSKGGKSRASNASSKSQVTPEDESEDGNQEPVLFDTELLKQNIPELSAKLYAMYPRKEARKLAIVAIGKALKRASFETLAAGIQKYVEDCTRNNTTYAHPATWFNNDRWTDESRDSKPNTPPRGRTDDDEPLPEQKGWEDLTPEQNKEWFGSEGAA